MKMNGKRWLWSSLGGGLAVSLLVFLLVHQPLREAIGRLEDEAAVNRQIVTEVQNYQNAHLDREAFMKELTEAEQQADKALPEEMSQGNFISRLQRDALRAGLRLRQVQPQETVRLEDCRMLPVHVELEGNYFALLKFLRELGKDERFMQLRGLHISSEKGVLLCDMDIAIYAWG